MHQSGSYWLDNGCTICGRTTTTPNPIPRSSQSQPLCIPGGGGVWPKHETTLSPKCVKCYFNYPHDTVLRHRYNVNSEKQSSHRLKPYGRWRWKRNTNSRHTLNRLSEPVFFRGGRSGAVEAAPFSTFPWLSFRRGGGSHFLLKRTNHSTWQLKYDNLISHKINTKCCL